MAIFGKKKEKEIKNEELPEAVGEKIEAKTVLPVGEDARAYQMILAPHQTEKAGLMAGLNKYVFRVGSDSNKIEIRKAIEKLYKVKVNKVAVLSMPAKARRLGRTTGFRPGFKKAIVTLVEGDKIDISS
ncbi:MAG: 50S ribosomal protein L23 [Patescibacteria group bacterium]